MLPHVDLIWCLRNCNVAAHEVTKWVVEVIGIGVDFLYQLSLLVKHFIFDDILSYS